MGIHSMYESEFKKIIEASQNHSLTFFVGAGVSALSNVPTWKEIIDTIVNTNISNENK